MAAPETHKAHVADRGEVVSPDTLHPYVNDNEFDPREHGGIMRQVGGRVLRALMPRTYRPGQTAEVHGKDLQELNLGEANRTFLNPETMLRTLSGTGSEYELHVSRVRTITNRITGAAEAVWHARPGQAVGLIDTLKDTFAAQPKDNKSAAHELWTTMIEVGTKGRVEDLATHRHLSRELLHQTDQAAEAQGLLFYPGSSSPVREPRVEGVEGANDEINPDKYVQQMAHRILGLERVRAFTGAGFQVHKEFNNARTALYAIVHGEHVLSVLQGLSTSSSADCGNARFDVRRQFRGADGAARDDPELATLVEPDKWHSVRRLQQEFSLGTGGSLKFLPPIEALYDKSMHALVKFLDKRGRGELASRVLGTHTNRLRVDSPGTIEVTHFDTAGYRLQRTDLLTETVQKYYTCMEWLADTHPADQEAYFRQFDLLFPEQPFKSQGKMREYVRGTRHNNLRIAHEAQHAEVVIPGRTDVRRASVREVTEQLEDFLGFMGVPLSPEATAELHRSLESPDKSATFDDYYQTGLGNFSEYFTNRHEALVDQGYTSQEALKLVTAEAGVAWRRYIRSDFALAV